MTLTEEKVQQQSTEESKMNEPKKIKQVAEAKVFLPNKEWAVNSHVNSVEQYKRMYKESIENPGKFWGKIASEFHWEKKWDREMSYNYNMNDGPVEIKWFENGVTNICYNAVDRHVANGKGDQVAFFWEGNAIGTDGKVTFAELQKKVCKFANVLKSQGVKKGDRVAVYLPMIIELPVVTLACARIGAIHNIVFAGFSAEALASRLHASGAKVLVVADGAFRGTKPILLKDIADAGIAACEKLGHSVKSCIVVKHVGDKVKSKTDAKRDVDFATAMKSASEDCPIEWMDAEDPLFMLYTSGSTGTPKGVLHSVGGYMIYSATTFKYSFDYMDKDIYFCSADVGWITGHTYVVYGPLLNGATSVMFEGIPTYPDSGRYWDIIDKYEVTQFYTAPTAIRSLIRCGDEYVEKYSLKSLRVLGTVGEPINPEAWMWFYEKVGRGKCSVNDTYWQTESGGHLIMTFPGAHPMKPGCAGVPFFGVEPVVVDKDGNELEGECAGYLVMRKPWPGQMRSVYGDHNRFEKTYFSQFKGYYCSSDGCVRDKDGHIWITGRIDDVINVSGHRIGTAEIESSFVNHPAVSEAASVGYPHAVKGEGIYVYVTLKLGLEFTPEIEKELKMQVRKDIGAYAMPDIIQNAPGLPKTRSGKIMRRILRKIAHDQSDELGDISTLADPSVVKVLIDGHNEKVSKK
eukprot:Nk52_evm1s410 gene=Nk52_evmTU1s410